LSIPDGCLRCSSVTVVDIRFCITAESVLSVSFPIMLTLSKSNSYACTKEIDKFHLGCWLGQRSDNVYHVEISQILTIISFGFFTRQLAMSSAYRLEPDKSDLMRI